MMSRSTIWSVCLAIAVASLHIPPAVASLDCYDTEQDFMAAIGDLPRATLDFEELTLGTQMGAAPYVQPYEPLGVRFSCNYPPVTITDNIFNESPHDVLGASVGHDAGGPDVLTVQFTTPVQAVSMWVIDIDSTVTAEAFDSSNGSLGQCPLAAGHETYAGFVLPGGPMISRVVMTVQTPEDGIGFDDFTFGPPPPSVPVLSQWGLLSLTLLVLTAGTLVFRQPQTARA